MTTAPKYSILIADDDKHVTEVLSDLLVEEGYNTAIANDGPEALAKLREGTFHLLLVDFKMPTMSGMEVLEGAKKEGLLAEIVIITGEGSVASAVEAMQKGAYDYLEKPIVPRRLKALVRKALERQALVVKNLELENRLKTMSQYEEIIGRDEAMLDVYDVIEAVADTTASVMITGESGTGKELVARAIHSKSGRAKGPFIAINCSAFPRDILENELFGHERGAFTGAVKEKPGCFEMANNGTLFLDEVGEMPADTQSKLLRVLEEKRFRRLGGTKEVAVDVRVVAATNCDIQEAMADGTLREDLYFRLSVMDIQLPPLRQRLSDLALITKQFLKTFNEKNGKQVTGFSDECLELMRNYRWPGNVRELKNMVERAVILCREDTIEIRHLPRHMFFSEKKGDDGNKIELGRPLHEIEREVIFRTLEMTKNNKTKAAQILGISLKTMHNKLNKYFEDESREEIPPGS